MTGMIAHVTAAAAVGRRLSLAEAWRLTRGQRWRLVGLTVLLGLMLVGILFYALTWVPVALRRQDVGRGRLRAGERPALPALLVLVLDPGLLPAGAGPDARAGRASSGRSSAAPPDPSPVLAHVRIALLTVLIAQVAGSMLSLPVSFAGQLLLATSPSSEYAVLGLVLSQALARRSSRPPSSPRSRPRSPPCSTSTSGCARRRTTSS